MSDRKTARELAEKYGMKPHGQKPIISYCEDPELHKRLNSSREHEQPPERELEWLSAGQVNDAFQSGRASADQVAECLNIELSETFGTPSDFEQRIREDERKSWKTIEPASFWKSQCLAAEFERETIRNRLRSERDTLRQRVRELEGANRLLRSHLPDYIQRMVDTQIELQKGDQ